MEIDIMDYSNRLGRTWFVWVLAVCCVTGCGQMDLPQAPKNLPAELAYVVGNKESFAVDFDTPLSNVPAGTVIDDLASLSGCWGNYRRESNSETPESQMALDNAEDVLGVAGFLWRIVVHRYEVYMVNPADGTMTFWTMEDWGGYSSYLDGNLGAFRVEDDNRVIETSMRGYSSLTENGTPNPNPNVVLEEIPPERRWDTDLTVTLSGDFLKIRYATNDPPDGRDVVTYRRFDCPR